MRRKGERGVGYYVASATALVVLLLAAATYFLFRGDLYSFAHAATPLVLAAWGAWTVFRIARRKRGNVSVGHRPQAPKR